MLSKLFAAAALSATFVSAGDVTVLTSANFESEVKESGKSSFIKFFAPWCGHCKAMAPAWNQLGTKFKDDTSVIIGDVDCTVETEVCNKFGVRGYPTIKYFKEGGEAQDYNGGRSIDDFVKFTEDTLSAPCTPAKQDKCSDKQKAYIEKMLAKDEADIKKELDRLTKMGAAKVAKDKAEWLGQRKALLPAILSHKEEL